MDRVFDDVDTGAIPPLRHWKGVEVIMDETMRVDGPIVIQGGTHRDTFRLAFRDWFSMVQPRVGAFSEQDHPAPSQSFVDREDTGMGA
jgi:prolyl-tRNA editing enzyme YbaK/EbsC (Cys-tRNA(Pro) deacylase)